MPADRERGDPRTVLRQMLFVLERDAEFFLEDISHCVNASHRNGDVLDALDLYGSLLSEAGNIGLSPGLCHTVSQSRIVASSFSGLLTRAETGQMTIPSSGNGRIRSAGS